MKYVILSALALLVIACKKTSEDGSLTSVTSDEILITSQFVDAPVAGLTFTSDSGSGTTDSNGTFSCRLGSQVTFKVGTLTLGSAPCTNTILPLHLTGETSVSATGGAVAMGVFLKNLDSGVVPGAYTIPTAVRNMTFASTIDFSSFNSATDLANLTSTFNEVNTATGSSIDSASIATNYAAVHAPATIAELNTTLANPGYVTLPSNITSFAGKNYLITATAQSDNAATCSSVIFYFGVGFSSSSPYVMNLYSATSTAVDTSSSLGDTLVTGVHAGLELTSGVTSTRYTLTFPQGNGSLVNGFVKTVNSTTGDNCTYTINGVESTVTATPTPTPSALAVLTISDGATYDFGTQTLSTSTDKSFTVTNSGNATATGISGGGISAPFAFKGGTYPGTGGTCAASLASAATCTMVVTYAPTTAAAHTDQIVLSYNDGASSQSATRDIQGTGSAGAVGVLIISDGPSYDFGLVTVGNSSTKMFTVTNTGSGFAIGISDSGLAAPFSFQGGAYPGMAGTCGATLAAGATCMISVNYDPVTMAVHSDTIGLDYNDGTTAQTTSRPVTGTGN